MKRSTSTITIAVLLASGDAAFAQAPPRPADQLRSDPSRTATLSLAEYNRLIDLARRPTPPTPAPPVNAVLSSADLRVRIDRGNVQGVFNLAGDVLQPGLTRVPLVSGATILEGTMDGRPLPLVAEGATHTAVLAGPGPFAVSLEWGAPLTFAPGRASFTLPVPPAGSARATIDLPGEQADAHIADGVITRRTTGGGRTVVEVTLRPGTAAEVWWSMRDSAPVAAAREVRMLADVYTLVTIGDSDVRMAALIELNVVQGEPRVITLQLPSGYELAGIAGSAVESSEARDAGLVLTLAEPAARRHQLLVSLERAHAGGSFSLDTDFIALSNVQRERGEIAVEGFGTLDLNTSERPGMHRIDVRELNSALQSLARQPLLAAFRYQRTATTDVALAMQVKRFGDANVLAAAADRAVATTLITVEGRALTEVVLHVRNRAQPFLKVMLPAGGTIVSVEVAGETAKPVVGPDGTRIPLLRPGLRPTGAYTVSFVYLHAGVPFAKKGELQMMLPKMDIPVGVVEWEMYVPDRYAVRAADGNMIDRAALGPIVMAISSGGIGGGVAGGVAAAPPPPPAPALGFVGLSGQVRGRVRDGSGAPVPGATVVLSFGNSRQSAVSGADGTYVVSGVPSGQVSASAASPGFATRQMVFAFDQQPRQIDFVLTTGGLEETITVNADTPASATVADAKQPSQNVVNLQKRAAGVLPIRIDVPRAGTSHQFVKPLLVDQQATVTLRYKRR